MMLTKINWGTPNYWRTNFNAGAKLFLPKYYFEVMKMLHVQFKTDENNIKLLSRY